VTQSFMGLSDARNPLGLDAGGKIPRAAPPIQRTAALPEGLALIRPVYWVAGCVAAGGAYLYGGIETASLIIAAVIALWAFAEPRATLWLCTAFMVFLFVFFQTTAPLGEEVPEEFFYWGVGIALITTCLAVATFFSSEVDWAAARKRFGAGTSTAMLGMLLVILAATVYGLFAGNQMFAAGRQLFGCLLLPVYYFLGIVLFRSAADIELWLRRVSWVVTLGSVWYVARLSVINFANAMYYREQSPLVAYSGAIAVVAWSQLITRRRAGAWLQAFVHLLLCVSAILLMGNRTTLGSFLAAIAVLTAMIIWKRRVLALALTVSLLPIGMGIAPYVMTRLAESRGLEGNIAGRFIFALSEDQSYQGRLAQTEVVMNMVERRPVLGAGMGSENTFILPGEQHRVKVASVDSGWGYLLLKMGYLGLAVFLVLVALLLQRGFVGLDTVKNPALRANRLAAIGVFLYALVSFLGGPTYFHFSVAPFFATALGALVVLGEVRDAVTHTPIRMPGALDDAGRGTHCA
jgi:O-antigen ligase